MKEKLKDHLDVIVLVAVAIAILVGGYRVFILGGQLPSVDKAEKAFKEAGYTVEKIEQNDNSEFDEGFTAKSYATYIIYGKFKQEKEVRNLERYTTMAVKQLFGDTEPLKVEKKDDVRGIKQVQTTVGSMMEINAFRSNSKVMLIVGTEDSKDEAIKVLGLEGKKRSKK